MRKGKVIGITLRWIYSYICLKLTFTVVLVCDFLRVWVPKWSSDADALLVRQVRYAFVQQKQTGMLRTGHLPIIGEGEHVEVCDIFVVSFLYPLLALFLVYELPDILIHKLTLKHKHEKQISFRVTLVTMAIHYNTLSLTFITIVIHNNSLNLNFITIVIHYKSSNLLASQQASFSECLTSLKCPWWGYIHSINKGYKGWFYLIYGNLEKIKIKSFSWWMPLSTLTIYTDDHCISIYHIILFYLNPLSQW